MSLRLPIRVGVGDIGIVIRLRWLRLRSWGSQRKMMGMDTGMTMIMTTIMTTTMTMTMMTTMTMIMIIATIIVMMIVVIVTNMNMITTRKRKILKKTIMIMRVSKNKLMGLQSGNKKSRDMVIVMETVTVLVKGIN